MDLEGVSGELVGVVDHLHFSAEDVDGAAHEQVFAAEIRHFDSAQEHFTFFDIELVKFTSSTVSSDLKNKSRKVFSKEEISSNHSTMNTNGVSIGD